MAVLQNLIEMCKSLKVCKKIEPVGEVVCMAIDRGGCGGKSDGEVEDGSPNLDWIKINPKFYCQNSFMIILNFTILYLSYIRNKFSVELSQKGMLKNEEGSSNIYVDQKLSRSFLPILCFT